jgi:hypothetical protein
LIKKQIHMTNDYLDMGNRLLCTFAKIEELDNKLDYITTNYNLLSDKIFILSIKSNNEYAITYNIDTSNSTLLENTIAVHRKKESNTLYSLNALNEIIKKLNNGVVDVSFRINWSHYRNSILLTQYNEIKQLNTKVHKIINI